jgi:hypothetical protein
MGYDALGLLENAACFLSRQSASTSVQIYKTLDARIALVHGRNAARACTTALANNTVIAMSTGRQEINNGACTLL